MIKINYLFFWQVVKETFSKTKGYIGLFAIGYIFIDFIYPEIWIFLRDWIVTIVVSLPTVDEDDFVLRSNKLFYSFYLVTELLKIFLIIGLFKVTISYLDHQKFLLKNYFFGFYHLINALLFTVFFGLLFLAVNYLIGMFLIGTAFIQMPLGMLILLFTLPVFIFITHPQFSILKIIKRSYQLFYQKPLAILGLYFIMSLVWWVYSFYIVDFTDQFIIDFSRNFYHDPLFLYSTFYYFYYPIIKGVIMLFTLLSVLIAYNKIAKTIDEL